MRGKSAADAAGDGAQLRASLDSDEDLRRRFFAILGMSVALTDHLVRHPRHWRQLSGPLPACTSTIRREALLLAVGADPQDSAPTATAAVAWHRVSSLTLYICMDPSTCAPPGLPAATTPDCPQPSLPALACTALQRGRHPVAGTFILTHPGMPLCWANLRRFPWRYPICSNCPDRMPCSCTQNWMGCRNT